MGKLLFMNTNRTNGIVGLIACLVVIGLGVGAAFTGTYAGIVCVPLGLFFGKVCLKTATQRSELYEQGYVSKSVFGAQSGRYADLKSILRVSIRRSAVVTTNIYLVPQSGGRLNISREALGDGDKESQLLLDCACRCMAENWAKALDRNAEVVWLMKGSKPLLKIRKEGVLVEGVTGADGLIPLSRMRVQPRHLGGVDVLNGDRRVATVSSSAPNYYVGLSLIATMLEKQTQAFAASSRA